MAARFRTARMAMDLSQNRLAKLAGCTAATINQIEAGEIKTLKAALLFRISDTLEVSARWLLWGTGPVHKWAVLTPEEDALLHAFRALPNGLKDHAASLLNGLLAASGQPSQANPLPTAAKSRK